ncbi:VacJ family lipoprotein [Acinetobacter sp. TGL-Y2]|uniref:MlaA family lipoprotein n=1 Tax=Acinetobacter sp. TGL-Y2 TaxID=1407071 RepID=UPI0007A65FA6|nr:VacJ family lipoprotein [Acinetobacter sp. TGL-Y2]AMW77946.1 VacJ family lipoprotein [Acinetobacter sp. TGL-Y2]
MHRSSLIWVGMLSFSLSTPVFAQDESINNNTTDSAVPKMNESPVVETKSDVKHPRLESLKELKNLKVDDLKVNASAAQSDGIKDPLQPLNRQIYEFNDMLDRNVARPLAVQYTEKVPTEVRGSYRQFRKNLGEPWNAVNQVAQGRFGRAAQTLGRFTLNTVTTLGFADPARRLGLGTEDESLGTTLGYYGVPSGPYLMLPLMGPSTLRDGLSSIVDSQARPQKYLLEDNDRLYYSEQVMRGIDARSQLLDVEDVLQGDKYAAIRDIYLQRKNFQIAQKKGGETGADLFIDSDGDADFIK